MENGPVIDRYTTHTNGRRGFFRFLGRALQLAWQSPLKAARQALWVIGVSAPLFLVGYHEGAYPVVGLVLSIAMGAALTVWLISQELGRGRGRKPNHILHTMGLFAALAAIIGLILMVVMNALMGAVGGLQDSVVAIVANTQAFNWKPVSHVALGASVVFALSPSMLMVIPLLMKHEMKAAEAFMFVGGRVEGKNYRWLPGTMTMIVIASTLVWIPVVALFVPGMVAGLSMTMYREVFSSRA